MKVNIQEWIGRLQNQRSRSTMSGKIQEWLNWLQLNRSQSTLKSYAWELGALLKACPKESPADYVPADLTAYLANRRANRVGGVSDAALKRSVMAFRSFFQFACGERSPAAGLPCPKPKRRLQRTLDEHQALAVLAACEPSTPTGARDLALMALMLDSGVRAAEVCRLRLDKVDLVNRVFHVVIKGGHEEMGTYTKPTANFLNIWLAHRQHLAQPGVATVFVSVGGLKRGQPLTTDGLRRVFAYIGGRAGLGHFSPHDLRRSFATLSIRNGAPTKVVQVAGRWESLDMVEGYAKAIRHRDFDQYSPVARLLGS